MPSVKDAELVIRRKNQVKVNMQYQFLFPTWGGKQPEVKGRRFDEGHPAMPG